MAVHTSVQYCSFN